MTALEYHEADEEELFFAIGYLELQAKGLGRRFHAEIRSAEQTIAEYPEVGRCIAPGIRKFGNSSSKPRLT